MRATSDLTKLHDAVRRRLFRIARCYVACLGRPQEDRNIVISHCVLELDNLVICAIREFTVSTLWRARTVRGHRVSTNRAFTSEGEIGAYILSVTNSVKYANRRRPSTIRRDEEPTLRDPKETEKVLLNCNASNLPSLQRALSLNINLFRDLATLRNFYAHRNEDTWRKVRNKALSMGVSAVRHPDDLIQATISGRPVSVFEDWLVDARIFFEEAMK